MTARDIDPSQLLFFNQGFIVGDVILRQKIDGLSHLLQIENLSPALIARTFSGLQLGLDIHQEIDLVWIFSIRYFGFWCVDRLS